MSITGNKRDALDRLQQLTESYKEGLPDMLSGLITRWKKIEKAGWDADSFRQFHKQIHDIAGNAGSFGQIQLGKYAQNMDLVCRQIVNSGETATKVQLHGLKVGLQSISNEISIAMLAVTPSVEQNAELPTSKSTQEKKQLVVFIVDDDPDYSEYIVTTLSDKGYKVHSYSDTFSMEESITVLSPDVILMDIMLPEGDDAGLTRAAEIKENLAEAIPIIFTSVRSDLKARLEAVRVGGDAYFSKPIDINILVDKIDELAERQHISGSRVLMVDDDILHLQYSAATLRQAGMRVSEFTDPIKALEEVEQQRFDIIILDLHMPEINGTELASLIRQGGHQAGTPIIFLSAEIDQDIQADALLGGAEDFIVKPVKPKRLIATIKNRIGKVDSISRKIRYLSEKESVTGLFNRQYFFNKLEQAIEQAKDEETKYGMLYIAIDNYVSLRDKIGVDSWDKLLAVIAERITAVIDNKVVIASISGHTIGVLCKCADDSRAKIITEKILQEISQTEVDINGHMVSTTCSIGLVVIDEYTISVAHLMYEADIASETIQKSGGNGVFVHSDQQQESFQEGDEAENIDAGVERLLRKALDDGEGLYLIYQPIVNFSNGNEEKYDVMVRLKDTDDTEVLPSRFMPIAEKQGLLGKLDDWVFENAIKVLARRQQEGNPAIFFVKLTIDSLNDTSFVERLKYKLNEYGIPGRNLCMELSEPMAETNLRQAMQFSRQIKELGCSLTIEHFGKGLDSGKLLNELPVDYIKIDGAFMHNLGSNTENKETVIRVTGEALNKEVFTIASFVEDADSLAVLWSCGVNYMQGNFLQEPDADLKYDFNTSSDHG